MSFKATLFIFDKEYPLLKLDYNLAQPVDYSGRPQGRTSGGKIYTTFAATKDDSGIYEAMFSPDQMVQGYIRVYRRDGMQKDFDIKFANTFVINANTRFNHDGTVNLLMDVEFSALIMKIRNSIYESTVNPSNPFIENNVTPTVREEKESIRVSNVKGPFDEAGNKVKYISPIHKYYYHVTLKNYEEGDDLDQVQWSVTYDDQEISMNENLTTGGDYEDGILKTAIKISKGKQSATIYAHTGNPNSNLSTTVTYKQVITFFIGGAGDKASFYGSGVTGIMKDVESSFNVKIGFLQYQSKYLGYNQVKGEKDIKNNVLDLIFNKDGTQINIVGHSLGGWNGAHLSNILSNKGYIVNTLITLDPVGEGGGVTIISDIHTLFPSPKADFWVNIHTDPKDYRADDLIADLGGQWIPRKNKPHVNHIIKCNHGKAKEMFNEILAKKTISASSILSSAISKFLEKRL
ncbi:type VI secretion system tube protein TssD [Aquimarina sp. RZ0]|uniref:type VI secretion system tube protein TssD n=1 Tax=Aquimarina sp. RZ0 TaxID=2607730 RepID=UPI0011F2366E|nr:type VI secretion system tube protein TssD [Aquimarina sp. RZ0]KAA1243272.1 hypothetical protein F0000_21705 [Aquimarina sp. RZ0]